MDKEKEGNLLSLGLERHLNIINAFIQNTVNKHNISFSEIIEILEKKAEKKKSIEVPCSILKQRPLGILEIVTRYLKEHHKLKYSNIASLLNRDPRLIWVTYNKAKEKSIKKLNIEEGCIWIPASIFADRRFGPLEAVTKHLKEECKLNFSEIAGILGRDNRTIWTCYNRIKKKSND